MISRKIFNIFTIVFCFTFLTSCSGLIGKTYDGDLLNTDQIAFIQAMPGITICKFNGKAIHSSRSSIDLCPHMIEVMAPQECRISLINSFSDYKAVYINVEPGKIYKIQPYTIINRKPFSFFMNYDGHWDVDIIEVKNSSEKEKFYNDLKTGKWNR